MQTTDLFVRTVTAFSRRLLTDYDVSEVLEELAERATELLDLAGSGVSLARDGRLEAVTAVPVELVLLEEQQTTDQAGPSIASYATGDVVTIPDLEQEERWPGYRRVAASIGIRSVAAVPLVLTEEAIGSFTLYSKRAGSWSEEDLTAVTVLASMATAFLINASALAKQVQLAEQLQHALDTRVLIEQAKGILAGARSISVDQAYGVIRRYSRDRNLKIRDVAHAIIHMGVRPT
ncbi:transcriptional regulator [Serinibacter arcticus]|uniref:Transcriptional regulator n=1 Tax=Serinibacter arcticus TaxID=1655435 RepID=A0A2U1ZX51_9MICO|nr:GAF and ANTAR domain-containing protein [Serinibacter arcticus]PWD51567.1 transcriptional regulator [Serinibacter arcticus]